MNCLVSLGIGVKMDEFWICFHFSILILLVESLITNIKISEILASKLVSNYNEI